MNEGLEILSKLTSSSRRRRSASSRASCSRRNRSYPSTVSHTAPPTTMHLLSADPLLFLALQPLLLFALQALLLLAPLPLLLLGLEPCSVLNLPVCSCHTRTRLGLRTGQDTHMNLYRTTERARTRRPDSIHSTRKHKLTTRGSPQPPLQLICTGLGIVSALGLSSIMQAVR